MQATDGQIVGSIAVKRSKQIKVAESENFLNNTACLKQFYVLSEYDGSGIAQQMHNTVIEWCQQNCISQIYLWLDTRFTRAYSFYQKNGYEQKGIRDMNDGAMPYQEYLFVKDII